jgi:hypothetical protein
LIERRAVAVAPLNEQLGDSGCQNHSFRLHCGDVRVGGQRGAS